MSGQLVLYRAAQYTGESTSVLLTGRNLMQYSRICKSVLPLRNETIVCKIMPSTFSSQHTKFERNCFMYSQIRDKNLLLLA